MRTRLGVHAEVRVEDLQARGDLDAPLVAVPAPGARTARRIRFVLSDARATSTRVGEAHALVFVAVPHLRAGRRLRRGSGIKSDAVVDADGDVGSVLLQALPNRQAVTGAIAARDVAPGEVLTPSLLRVAILVKPGDKIVVRASAGGLEVQATLVAAQSGRLGDVIRCVNPDTRRTMAARIVGRGVAEVVHAF